MEKNDSFFDSKTIIAIVLVGFFWFGWQKYLEKKYPQLNKQTVQAESVKDKSEQTESTNQSKETTQIKNTNENIAVDKEIKANGLADQKVEYFNFISDNLNFQVSSNGLSLQNIKLNKFTDREKNPIEFGNQDSQLFQMRLLGYDRPLNFKVNKIKENQFEGVAIIGKTKVVRQLIIDEENYSIENKVSFENLTNDLKGFQIIVPEKLLPKKSSSFLTPSYEHQEVFFKNADKSDRINVSSDSEKLEREEKAISLISIASQYFTTAFIDKSEILPNANLFVHPGEKEFNTAINYEFLNNKDSINYSFVTYAGPKALDVFDKFGNDFNGIINFGFFSSIAKILLIVLKWFHSFVGNWGVSIICLTLLARVIVLPFNISSYKSMKKMQKVQPLMQALRERYKDDPQTLNREMMVLMKEQKVNPIGGCLPMLLQMPIFFALFQVLGHSIELYQAPFFGWITDLSLKDPFYVLPVLMGLTLFIQHKITPTTMDPNQAKVMQFMPVVFSLMMVSLPSGLTLYTFVSTLFGILQQQFFMHDRHTNTKTAGVKA